MFFVCFQLHSIHAQPAQQLLVQKQQRQLSDVAAANERWPQIIYRYNVCNGLSNQPLLHASGIARAIQSGATIVHVPDYFIVNGEQTSDDNLMPTEKNSVPLSTAFDAALLKRQIEDLGIRLKLVRWKKETRPECERLSSIAAADPQLVLQVLQAFQPSRTIKALTKTILSSLQKQDMDQGVCFHHRNGQDWYEHCSRWSNASTIDGIYRGNCKEIDNNKRTLVQLLEDRALTSTDRWVYYCGDHGIPRDLSNQTKYRIFSKDHFMSEDDRKAVQAIKPGTSVRDVWALMDYSVCNSLPYFVGNSVSTFSALQIAARQQKGTYWYNSQSIPLGDVWNIYQIPIVYTYTELSDPKGKYMLQASISSLRQHMPLNNVAILYHGHQDKKFQQWLRDQNVDIFSHDPKWRGDIERMRQNGYANTSHLFSHEGNYFGTWQRIDIPRFIETEYCLLLDADTLVLQSFTLNDFGLNLTHSIAMSAERHRHHRGNLLNAGVTLMNVPQMRATYNDFLKFILDHVNQTSFKHLAPSDQGAYLEYYDSTVQQISNFWNWKAYWGVNTKNGMFRKIKILHFHGIKPHDFIRRIMGYSCGGAIHDLCGKFKQNIFRVAVNRFLQVAGDIPNFKKEYCAATFNTSQEQGRCAFILDDLQKRDFNVYTTQQRRQQRQQHTQEQLQQPESITAIEKKRRRWLGMDGYWDGDHRGLSKNIVSVSRPASRKLEENRQSQPTKKMKELSYAHLNLSDEIGQDLFHRTEEQVASATRLQYRLLFLTGTLSFFFAYLYSHKNRRIVFLFVCGSVVIRHIHALKYMT